MTQDTQLFLTENDSTAETKVFLPALGQAIIKLRRSKGWKQGKLANKLGVSQAHVSRLENALDKPSLDMLIRYARVLEVEPSYLINIYVGQTQQTDLAGAMS